jgi:hypothetical protein
MPQGRQESILAASAVGKFDPASAMTRDGRRYRVHDLIFGDR